MLRDLWVGGRTERLRRFSFGTHDGRRLPLDTLALHPIDGEPAVTCDLRRRPVRLDGRRKPTESGGRTSSLNRGGGAETLERMLELQGLPTTFFGQDCPLTQTGRKRVIGNGVPLPMGRAVACAVRDSYIALPTR
jgi:DNA (cytosine-5)-methyltransferase 1